MRKYLITITLSSIHLESLLLIVDSPEWPRKLRINYLLPVQNPAVSGLSQCRFVHQYRTSQNPIFIIDTL